MIYSATTTGRRKGFGERSTVEGDSLEEAAFAVWVRYGLPNLPEITLLPDGRFRFRKHTDAEVIEIIVALTEQSEEGQSCEAAK